MKLVRNIVAGVMLAGLLGGVTGLNAWSYAKAAIHDGKDWLESTVLPTSWIVKAEADKIERLAVRRHQLMVKRDHQLELQQQLNEEVAAKSRERVQLADTSFSLGKLLDTCRARCEIAGRDVTRSEVAAMAAQVGTNLATADRGIADTRKKIAGVEAEIRSMNGTIGELDTAEGQRRAALSKLITDEALLNAQLEAIQARVAARAEIAAVGDEASPLQSRVDRLRAQVGVAREHAGDAAATPAALSFSPDQIRQAALQVGNN